MCLRVGVPVVGILIRNDSARILKELCSCANACCDAVVRGCAVGVLVGTVQWRPVAGVAEHFGCGS